MAEIDFDAFGGRGVIPAAPTIRSALSWAGGALSLGLVIGLVAWGYQIVVRDVSGVPVVRALEGPMRIAPEDPGGQQAEHQGLAVNNVAAAGEAAAPADTLRLAPRPVVLADEDRPRAEMAPQAPARMTAAPEDAGAAPVEVALSPAAMPELAVVPASEAAPLPEVDLADELAAVAIEDAASPEEAIVPLLELPDGALSHSPRPLRRPEGEDLAAAAAIAAAMASLAPARASELAADEIVAGTALVQLGAFDDTGEAREAWDVLAGQDRFVEFFNQKSRVVQSAESGGRTFYRLRAAGFADLADARRFCAALVAEGADCIPVVAR